MSHSLSNFFLSVTILSDFRQMIAGDIGSASWPVSLSFSPLRWNADCDSLGHTCINDSTSLHPL